MKKSFIILAAVLTIFTGCKKGWLDINHNPNSATSATPELVLPAALVNTAARLSNPLGTFNFIAGWMGYIAISGSYAIGNSDFTTYKQTNDFGDGIWQGVYDNLADYNYVVKQAKAQGKPFYQGAGQIMKAMNFAILIDLFNNIPYTEAFNGTSLLQPKYEDAATIYGDLFTQISAGMTLIKNAPDVPDAKSDVLFSADAAALLPSGSLDFAYIKREWQKFGNTLKLRMLIQMSEMPTKPAYFNAELAKVAAEPAGFLDIDATVNPGYLNTAGKLNPFYASNYSATGTYTNDFWRANAFGISFYLTNVDPRLTKIYNPITGGAFVGNTLGVSGAVGSASSTFFIKGGTASGFANDAPIMLASESYFLQAEAALRGWISGSPQALYEKGVTASFLWFGLTSTDAVNYYTQAGNTQANFATATTEDQKLTIIMKQKWAAEAMQNVLVPFNDYRRFVTTTRSPKPLADLPLSQSPSVDIRANPYRLLYPRSEINTNTANVPTGIDHHTSKIFWMK